MSGFKAKLDRPRERYLATVFCYGCGLGPSQAARALKGLERRHVVFANQRHITKETLDNAITGVIDAHGQSAPIFKLAHLLGIKLMPRIRSWPDLPLFQPDADTRYKHSDGLFTGAIDWP